MKKCNTCNIAKHHSEFGKVARNKDGLNGKCKSCKRAYDNLFHENRSKDKKDSKYIKQKARLDTIREFLNVYLDNKVCNHCGDNRKVVLEFHHIRNKEFNLADSIRKSIPKIKKELEKCEILCANCHRIVTANERNYFKIK